MRLVIGIATTGRPGIVAGMLKHVARQTIRPDRVIIAIADPEDIDPDKLDIPADIVIAQRGCSKQRNAILARASQDDLLIFLDDDFLMAQEFCEQARALFARNPSIVMATGDVIVDGISGPGLTIAQGEHHLDQRKAVTAPHLRLVYNAYGCNMVLRIKPAIDNAVRFDERLPLYSWLEDVDFSRQMAVYGDIVFSNTLRGVHLGTKTWRTPGVKLGYSQVANPLYLKSKGTMAGHRATKLMLRNMAMNTLRAPRPEPWVDRRGRLRGNMIALADLVLGKMRPERAETLQ